MTYDYHPSLDDKEFVDFLLKKLISKTDTDLIDLSDDDSHDDHLKFEQLTIDPTD